MVDRIIDGVLIFILGANALTWLFATALIWSSNRKYQRARTGIGTITALKPAKTNRGHKTGNDWMTIEYAGDRGTETMRSNMALPGKRVGDTVTLDIPTDGKPRVRNPWHTRWVAITGVTAVASIAALVFAIKPSLWAQCLAWLSAQFPGLG